MPHEVERMMYVGKRPWHGLGTEVAANVSAAEAIRAAGLDWQVELVGLETHDTHIGVDHVATRRSTDGRILGVVGKGWTPVQNDVAFSFFDGAVQAGEARYETAGSLRNGQRVWILAKVTGGEADVVAGDQVSRYALLSNAHDGSMAVRAGWTDVRAVCANTLAQAHASRGAKLLRLRHTRGVSAALDEVKAVMDYGRQEFQATVEQWQQMARRNVVSLKDLRTYVQQVFTPPRARSLEEDDGVAIADKTLEERKRVVAAVLPLFERGRGASSGKGNGTWWCAYNAVTEYLTWGRGKDQASRMDSLWFGTAAGVAQRAHVYALQAAA